MTDDDVVVTVVVFACVAAGVNVKLAKTGAAVEVVLVGATGLAAAVVVDLLATAAAKDKVDVAGTDEVTCGAD